MKKRIHAIISLAMAFFMMLEFIAPALSLSIEEDSFEINRYKISQLNKKYQENQNTYFSYLFSNLEEVNTKKQDSQNKKNINISLVTEENVTDIKLIVRKDFNLFDQSYSNDLEKIQKSFLSLQENLQAQGLKLDAEIVEETEETGQTKYKIENNFNSESYIDELQLSQDYKIYHLTTIGNFDFENDGLQAKINKDYPDLERLYNFEFYLQDSLDQDFKTIKINEASQDRIEIEKEDADIIAAVVNDQYYNYYTTDLLGQEIVDTKNYLSQKAEEKLAQEKAQKEKEEAEAKLAQEKAEKEKQAAEEKMAQEKAQKEKDEAEEKLKEEIEAKNKAKEEEKKALEEKASLEKEDNKSEEVKKTEETKTPETKKEEGKQADTEEKETSESKKTEEDKTKIEEKNSQEDSKEENKTEKTDPSSEINKEKENKKEEKDIIENPLGNSTLLVENLDENNQPVVGVKYELSEKESKKVIIKATTGKDGIYIFKSLDPGQYQLEQVFTPEGYNPAEYIINIKVDDNKNATYTAVKISNENIELDPQEYQEVLEKEKEEVKEENQEKDEKESLFEKILKKNSSLNKEEENKTLLDTIREKLFGLIWNSQNIAYASGSGESLANPTPITMLSTNAETRALAAEPVAATGKDVGSKLIVTNNNPGTITLQPNTSNDTYNLDLTIDVDSTGNTIKKGDYFDIVLSNPLRPNSIAKDKVVNITDNDGKVIAEAQYDGKTTIRYVFTSYMDNYKNIKGRLVQPLNLNVASYSSDRSGTASITIAGTTYSNYYYIYSNQNALNTNNNLVFSSSILEVDNENKTFVQYVHLNPNEYYMYNTNLTISPTSDSSAMINSNTKVELYVYNGNTASSFNVYSPIYLSPATNSYPVTKNNNSISINFGNNLYNYGRYVVKITGQIDESGKPISLDTALRADSYSYYNTYSSTKTISYTNASATSNFTGDLIFQPIDFKITKYNEMHQNLNGASFRIEGDNGYSKTIDGSNSHEFVFEKLPLGNYKIIETKVPNGYIEPISHWEFTVTKDDTGRAIISTPDFPMEIKTDDNAVLKGDFPDPYDSQYSDLVRNPFNQSRDLENGKGSINTRIIGKEGTNTYKMEVVVRVNANQTISNLQIHEVMGPNFNIDKGIDNRFDREDFSLTASDGSFLYIEPGRDSGVYGGEPFGTNKIFTGSKIVYNQSADRISITGTGTDGSGWKVSAGNEQAWIKLTYNVTFDDSKIKSLDDKTFYRVGENSYVKTTANKLGASSPAIRPIIINTQTDSRVDIINTKLPATLELQKVGPKREYNAEGKIVKEELKPLEGAEFELYKSQTTSVSDAISTNRRVISGAKGEITFDNLQRNYVYSTNQQSQTYYWLKELSAPTGYDLINGLVGPFTINYFGGIEYAGGDLKENAGEPGVKINTNGTVREDSAVKYTVNDADKGVYETTLYQIANTRINHKGEIDIFKYDEDGKENPQTNKKPPIEGTQFTIYRVSGEKGENSLENWTGTKVETKATDKSGKAQFINLEEGYYRLEETKPADGYIKSDKVWQIKVDNEGFTSIVQVHPQTQNKAANTNTGFRSAFRSAGLFSPRAFSPMNLRNATDIGADVVSKIEASHYLGLYSAGDHEYIYTDKIDNHTGFTEKYQNPIKTTELYSFNGEYKDKALNNVAGVNKYVVPTGKPGEYEVHVRVAGNRVDSTTGIVLVYDNSNSMQVNASKVDRLTAANKSIESFIGKLIKPGDDSTKAALVTYGSSIFNQYGMYEFTNNPDDITSKLPTKIPNDDSRGGSEGGTYTQGALAKANDLFNGTTFDNKIIITISDGVPTYSNYINRIKTDGSYSFNETKIGTGNRFISPFTIYDRYNREYTGYVNQYNQPIYNYYYDSIGKITDKQHYYDWDGSYARYTTYRNYWVIDETKTYDTNADYAKYSSDNKYYVTETGDYYWSQNPLPRPTGGYGYKLINNHGYATIEQGRQIKESGIQMYTIGIQIDKSNISGTSTPDATRDQALEVMFGISSSKDTYFDAQNLEYLDTYLSQILAELEEKNAPTVNRGILTDPMGDMVLLDKGTGNNSQVYSLRDVGKKPIPREILDAIKVDHTGDRQIKMSNLNLSRDQEIELVYKVHLNTEAPGYKKDTMYETNGETTLQPNGDYPDKKWQLPLPKISGPDTSMMLTKIWQDAEGNTPSETHPVNVQLQRKLVGKADSTYVNVGGPTPITSPSWNTYFNGLIPFDNNGNVYEYRILEVNPDGKYSILFEGNGYSRTIINRERQTQDVYNKINKIDFVKKDKSNEKVMPGVTFHLRKLVNGENQIVTRDGQQIYETVVSDTNGKIYFEKLAPGTYNIMEDTPKGYEQATNPVKTFIVGEDGVIRTDQSKVITEDDFFKTIYNTPIKAQLKVKKIDGSTKEPLKGAKFKLYIGPIAETATEVIEGMEYESDDQGVIDIGELRTEVQYWLEEVEAPEGYQEVPGKISIIMFDKTHISVNGQKIDDYSLNNLPLISNYKEITTELAIQKVKKDESGELDALSGATWKITQADGTEINPAPVAQRIVKEGQWPYGTFSKLKEGSYKIVEQTAPNGYLKFKGHFILEVKSETNQATGQKTNYINKITRFENEQDTPGTIIYENRQITEKGNDHMITVKGVDGETDVVGFRVVNDPNKLQIKKVDADSKDTVLEGVSFELLYESTEDIKEVTGTLANGKQVPLRKVHENHLLDSNLNTEVDVVRTTNESGLIVFDRLPKNITGGHEVKYYLKEIKAKDRYQLSEYYIGPFTVTSDSITGPDGKAIDGTVPFVVENYKKPDLQITKVDANNTETKLSGAEFELYKAVKNENSTSYKSIKDAKKVGDKITTGEGESLGIAKFEQLEEGLYWIKEIKAPKDYAHPLKDFGPYLVEKGKIYKVELDEEGNIKESPKELLDDITTATDSTQTYNETIKNKKSILPATGGPGTLLLVLSGVAVIIVGIVLFERKRSKKEKLNN